jgi:hypothetical protein
MFRARWCIASALLAAAALGAQAQTMKPGLWEVQQQMQMDEKQRKQMDEMRKQMAAMPPEQRKMMEDMMARQGLGVDLASGTQKVKLCLTKEDVTRDTPPVDQRKDCSYDGSRSGATQTIKYRCTKPASQGVIEIVGAGPERYTMKMNGTDEKGRPFAMQGEGRWLAADCGNVKPASAATKP